MSNAIHLHYEVSGEDFTRAGEASGLVKKTLKKLGYNSDAIRRVAIAMYEAEINMVIHAEGGYCDVDIYPDRVEILLADKGPGIPDVEKAMQEGYSTAPRPTTSAHWASERAWVCLTSKNTLTTCVSKLPSEWARTYI